MKDAKHRLYQHQNRSTRIDHAKDGQFGKKLFSQFLMCFQTAKKTHALRQSEKQVNPILPKPALRSVLRRAF